MIDDSPVQLAIVHRYTPSCEPLPPTTQEKNFYTKHSVAQLSVRKLFWSFVVECLVVLVVFQSRLIEK